MHVGSRLHQAKALTSNAVQVAQIRWHFNVVTHRGNRCAPSIHFEWSCLSRLADFERHACIGQKIHPMLGNPCQAWTPVMPLERVDLDQG
jgi:hypothetical protein